MFAAVVGHCFGRATPFLRNAPPRQSTGIVRRETIYRNRNAVQTNPATSDIQPVSASHQLRTVLLDGRNFDAVGDDGTASSWEERTVSSGQWPPDGPLRILINGG